MKKFTPEEIKAIDEIIEDASRALVSLSSSAKGENPSLEVQKKGDDTLVTEADYKSNEILMSGLKSLFPQITIVSEEDIQEVADGEGYWLIDPLDGTASFVDGLEDYAVLVSYVDSDRYVSAGWVAFPARGVTFSAVNGEFRVVGEVNSPRLSSDNELKRESVYLRKETEGSLPEEIISNPIHSGQAFYQFFTGEISGIILELGRLGTWDVAAPQAVIESLGGAVNTSDGERFRVEKIEMAGAAFIASPPKISDRVLELYRTL